MPDLSELRVVMVAGIHGIIYAISTGNTYKAIEVTLAASLCYLIVTGVFWLRGRLFPFDEEALAQKAKLPNLLADKEKPEALASGNAATGQPEESGHLRPKVRII